MTNPPPDDVRLGSDPAEEAFAQLLAEWDEGHASGKSTAATLGQDETPGDGSLHTRLERAQACLKLLKQIWPRTSARCDGNGSSGSRRAYARFGRYEVIRELGRGGHGVVFLAIDPALNRQVALKVPRPEVLACEELRLRFLREAEATARLDHPNILPVFEVGSDGLVCFTAAAYCDGGTLQDWLALGHAPLPSREAAQIVAELAAAVHHAHTRGVLHRDLKPSNVLLVSRNRDNLTREGTSGPVGENVSPSHALAHAVCTSEPLLDHWVMKIADFGLAKVVGGEYDSTLQGIVMGTANYMAPEQAAGRTRDIGVTTDVYSLGVILYELLVGAPPFLAASSLATLQRVERDDAAWPSKIRKQIPADLRTICLTCLEKDPGRRYASAAALAGDLRRFLGGEPISARPQGLAERTRRWCQRHPALAVVSAIAIAVSVGFLVQLFLYNHQLAEKNAELKQSVEQQRKLTADAQRLQHLAEERAEENRRRGFGSRLRLAQQFADAKSLRRLTETLQETIPEPGEQDLREFAWRYWWHRCRKGELFILPGHGQYVHAAIFSADGRLIATGSGDSSVRVWDAETGRQLARLQGMHDSVHQVAFSSDDKLLAAGDFRGGLKVWSTTDWALRYNLSGHAGEVRGLCFGDDRTLVSAGKDARLRVWDLNTGKMAQDHGLTHQRRITALAVAPRNKLLLAGINNGEIQIRSLSDIAKSPEILRGHKAEVYRIAVSLQENRLFTTDLNGDLRMWDLSARKPIPMFENGPYHQSPAAISPDGRWLAAAQDGGKVQVLDAATGKVQYERQMEIDSIGALAFAKDGGAVLITGGDGLVALWQPFEGPSPAPEGHKVEAWSVAFAKGGATFFTGSDDNTVREWETTTGRLVRTVLEQPGTVASIACSPDGTLLATTSLEEIANAPESVRLWKVSDGQQSRAFPGHSDKVYCVAFHPGGEIMATGCMEVIVWDVKGGKRVATLSDSLETKEKVRSIAFSRDGTMLAFGSEDGYTYLYDLPQLKRRQTFPSGGEVWSVAFSPDSQLLAAGIKDGYVTVWNPHTGQKRFDLKGHLQGVRCVAFTHDGQTIATASDDRTIKLWGPVTGQEFCTLTGHADAVYSLAFSPDDQWLASCSHDGAVQLWHAPKPSQFGKTAMPKAQEARRDEKK